MKTILNLMAIGLAGSLFLGASSARADLEVSASVSIHAQADFYAPLGANGVWFEAGSYGRCWRPAGVAVGWRPYCYGQWVWTDCGWYWESDEPWAWACYHYGWWVYDPVYAWIWVPGIEWGPAWVCCRTGGGYIGWAPLPPRGVTIAVAGPEFVFVQAARFQERVGPSVVIANNTRILQQTTVINNIKRETRTISGSGQQRVVVNEGPGVDMVQRATGKRLATISIREASRRTPVPARLAPASRESKAREAPAVGPDGRVRPTPEGKLPLGETKHAPVKPAPAERAGPPAKPGSVPGAERPPTQGKPSAPPRESPEGKRDGHHPDDGKGRGAERDKP